MNEQPIFILCHIIIYLSPETNTFPEIDGLQWDTGDCKGIWYIPEPYDIYFFISTRIVEGGIAEGGIAGCGISLQYHSLLWWAGLRKVREKYRIYIYQWIYRIIKEICIKYNIVINITLDFVSDDISSSCGNLP
jgi:hypothetical protein